MAQCGYYNIYFPKIYRKNYFYWLLQTENDSATKWQAALGFSKITFAAMTCSGVMYSQTPAYGSIPGGILADSWWRKICKYPIFPSSHFILGIVCFVFLKPRRCAMPKEARQLHQNTATPLSRSSSPASFRHKADPRTRGGFRRSPEQDPKASASYICVILSHCFLLSLSEPWCGCKVED